MAKTGQQATTTSAVALPSVAFSFGPVLLKAPKSNAAVIEIGAAGETTATGYILDPGDVISLPLANLNQLYLIGANTSDKLAWIGF